MIKQGVYEIYWKYMIISAYDIVFLVVIFFFFFFFFWIKLNKVSNNLFYWKIIMIWIY